jgi:hypothetical protein
MLFVTLPGAGTVTAQARSSVTVVSRAKRGKTARARRRHRRPVPRVVARTVASAHVRSATARVIRLRLRLAPSYRKLTTRTHGLYAFVRITFVAAGHPRLTDTLPTSFIRKAKQRRKR